MNPSATGFGIHMGTRPVGNASIEIISDPSKGQNNAWIDFKATSGNLLATNDYNARLIYNNTSNILSIWSAATGAITTNFGPSGFVGIGKESTAYPLDVNGNINFSGNLYKGGVQYFGPTGPTGVAGAVGSQGAEGAQGATGATGPTGPAGAAGAQGTQGTAGVQGATGPTGPTGPAGAAGAQGTQGTAGVQGATGPTGPTGPVGAAGTNGAAGAQGATGPTGPTGPAGAAGAQGNQGTAGVQGATGPTGPTGPASSYTLGTGTAGSTGTLMLVDETTGNLFYMPINSASNSFYVSYDVLTGARALNVGGNLLAGSDYTLGSSAAPWRKLTLYGAASGGNLDDAGIYFNSNRTIAVNGSATPTLYLGGSRVYLPGSSVTSYPTANAALHVNNVGPTVGVTGGFALLGTTGTIQVSAAGNRTLAGYFAGSIWSAGGSFIASSDSRIKRNIRDLSDGQSLEALRQINPVQYTYIDVLGRGSETVTGFLAQQVKDVFPTAVSTQSDVLPNIYSLQSVTLHESTLEIQDLSESIVNSLTIGQRIQFYDATNKQYEWPIQSIINSTTIALTRSDTTEPTFDPAYPNKLFVYGTYVDDFHTLNKDYLFTINFAATQELDRQVQALKAENADLKAQIAAIKAFVNMP